jgi:Uma2 family endonuclease
VLNKRLSQESLGWKNMTGAKRFVPYYTIDDYRRWEGDWELWNGIPVSMSPSPFGKHQSAAVELMFQLKLSIRDSGCQAAVLNEIDWVVRDDTVIRPDVLVSCSGIPDRHVESVPALVAEVISPSTEERDRTYKRQLYDEQGVRVYLLLDPEAKTLESYQRDARGDWQYHQVADELEFMLCDDCRIRVKRSSLYAG